MVNLTSNFLGSFILGFQNFYLNIKHKNATQAIVSSTAHNKLLRSVLRACIKRSGREKNFYHLQYFIFMFSTCYSLRDDKYSDNVVGILEYTADIPRNITPCFDKLSTESYNCIDG